MPAAAFHDDALESLIRKCIVFPADGSETRIVPMTARTVTEDDPLALRLYNCCVDMATIFGDDSRKILVKSYRNDQSAYLFFYNLSPNLPINLTIACLIGVTPSLLETRKPCSGEEM